MMSGDECVKCKICPFSLGVAFGFVKGFSLMLMALAGYFFAYWLEAIQRVGSMLHGYDATIVGSFWGLLWGFLCGFICGFVLGFVYNYCLCCCKRYCSKEGKGSCK